MERTFADFYRQSRLQRARAGLRKFWSKVWKWLAGIAVAALAALLGAYATGLLGAILPAPADVTCWAREWSRKPAPGTHFTILISSLAGDENGRQTERVRDVFLRQRGLDVRDTCRVVELDPAGGSLADGEVAALEHGRSLLDRWNADLLIWGEVKKADQELSLWFLSRETSGTHGAPSYTLTEKLDLPEDFGADLAAQLEAMALARVTPATEQAGTYLVDLLRPLTVKLARLIEAPTGGLDMDRLTLLRFSLALASQTLGEQAGEDEALERAVESYREVLQAWARERVPLDWAMTQNNLGNALSTLGEREEGTARLEGAVAAYRAALEVYTRERVPFLWALTQENVGLVLTSLGARRQELATLEQAVDAISNALEIFEKAQASYNIAKARRNLARAEKLLAEQRARAAAE